MSPIKDPIEDLPAYCDYYYSDDDGYGGRYGDDCKIEDDFMSKFTNYLGLAMDAVLFIHCMKNYRDIYPSVLSIVILFMFTGVTESIGIDVKKMDNDDLMTYLLIVMAIYCIIICRYCYAGCMIGKACCQGGGLKLQFMCIGTGM